MRRVFPILSLCFLVGLGLPAATFAEALALTPEARSGSVGQMLELVVEIDVRETVIGGEVEIEFDDTILALREIAVEATYADDPLLRCPDLETVGARGCPGIEPFLAIGHISGLPSGQVARLRFDALAEGTTEVSLIGASPFSDSTGQPVDFELGRASIFVPEPGLAVGLAIGCGALHLCARRRRM